MDTENGGGNLAHNSNDPVIWRNRAKRRTLILSTPCQTRAVRKSKEFGTKNGTRIFSKRRWSALRNGSIRSTFRFLTSTCCASGRSPKSRRIRELIECKFILSNIGCADFFGKKSK